MAAVDSRQVRAAAEQLSKLLSEFDAGAADFIEANRGALLPLFPGDGWQEFEKLVQAYSFSEAQSRMDDALKKMPLG
jgi:hypothetical protein